MGYEAHYDKDGKIFLRKSMIEEFNFCPAKFNKVWNLGQQTVARQIMLVGTRFHDFAEKFFDYCDVLPSDRWNEFIPVEFTKIEVEMATWFMETEKERLYSLTREGREDEWRPMQKELRMIHEGLRLEGTCDRIDWYDRSKDEVCVVEYKTGGSFNEESVIRQLAFYSMLWEETVGLGKVAKLLYINPRLRVRKYLTMERWHMDQMLKGISTVRKAIKNGDFPHKCSEVKYAMCHACTPDESGVFKVNDTQKFSVLAPYKYERFEEIFV
jgi:CRISPR/Cas system-associated exonuclease Cas4 (RecB family)